MPGTTRETREALVELVGRNWKRTKWSPLIYTLYVSVYVYIYIYIYVNTMYIYIYIFTHTLHCIALHYITLRIALHCITLNCITLHYITLHYITLHIYIHYTHTYRFVYISCVFLLQSSHPILSQVSVTL